MHLFLLRHGEAGPYIPDDASRALTPRGRQQLQAIASASAAALALVQQVYVSPYLRTQQTLSEISPFLPAHLQCQTVPWLTPDTPPPTALAALGAVVNPNQPCLLVTHQPLIGELLHLLCDWPAQYQPLGTSALAALQLEGLYPGGGQLNWIRQP